MDSLDEYLFRFYRKEEFPALLDQSAQWRKSRPLEGKRILDATPVFRNTMAKYSALLAAGAELSVTAGEKIPCDPEILKILPDFGIFVLDKAQIVRREFDLVADCAGACSALHPHLGFVELTRSGLEYPRDPSLPLFSADSGLIKRFETTLGTGESFLRALKRDGVDVSGKKVLIFGGGKVGSGVAWHALRAGAFVAVADKASPVLAPGIRLICTGDAAAVEREIAAAQIIVSVTGIAGVLAPWAEQAAASSALIVNMGVEDEFGARMPASRVENRKRPYNFILDEPTQMRYIEPTMALDNYGLLLLAQKKLAPGFHAPDKTLEEQIITPIRRAGLITGAELSFICNQR